MIKEEIIEGNKLIAEFMGGYLVSEDTYDLNYMSSRSYSLKEMKFYTSWDWIMSVVEKIESIKDEYHGRFGVYISSNTCTIQATRFRPDERIPDPPHYFNTATTETKLDATWLVVVKFIKWYNIQKDGK